MPHSVIGLDVGGANLKASHTHGDSLSRPFALWKYPDRLSAELNQLLDSLPSAPHIALTMTGELCDCWQTKQDGVFAIIDAVVTAAKGRRVHIWTNQGSFVDVVAARAMPYQIASANWLALATYAGRFVPTGQAILLDVGTTTTDLVPLSDGKPMPTARTDPDRLQTGELLYLGWKRTPLCAVGGARVAEFFATMHDICLYLDLCPEQSEDRDTADGRPATREAAAGRLARMGLHDLNTISGEELLLFAENQLGWITEEIARSLRNRLDNLQRVQTIILSGSGEFLWSTIGDRAPLAGSLAETNVISLAERHSTTISSAACAYAVAVLLAEQG